MFFKSIPNKKLSVNQEKIPSSTPSIISTASSLTKYPERMKTSRAAFNKLSASSCLNNRNPAVAFNTNGVSFRKSSGTNASASFNNDLIDSAPYFMQNQFISFQNQIFVKRKRIVVIPSTVHYDRMIIQVLLDEIILYLTLSDHPNIQNEIRMLRLCYQLIQHQ